MTVVISQNNRYHRVTSSGKVASSAMAVNLVDSSLMKHALDEFCNLLKSLVGPAGNKCLFLTSVDSLILTSSSSTLVSNLSFGNPIFQFLLQCIKSQTECYGDGGLYAGILLSKLLGNVIVSPIPQQMAFSILVELKSIVQFALQNSPVLRIECNLESIQPLLTVARSILYSKNSILGRKCDMFRTQVDFQISLLVKAFLLSEASTNHVLLSIQEMPDEQGLFNGVLYECVDEEHFVIKNMNWHSVPIMLFSVMLSDKMDCTKTECSGVETKESGKLQLEAAQRFVHRAASCGIPVIACQKIVHPSLLSELRRKGILVLQRLGKRMTEAVEKLSGAIPVASLNLSLLDSLPKFTGHLGKVEHLKRCGKNFVLLEGEQNSTICSLLLTSRSLECKEEFKVLARQVLVALGQAVWDKAVFPGAGCTEVFLCCFLSSEVSKQKRGLCEKINCSVSQLECVLQWLQGALLSAAKLEFSCGKLVFDSIYHHAWEGSDGRKAPVGAAKCNCGLVNMNHVSKLNGEWVPIMASNLTSLYREIGTMDGLVPSEISIESIIDLCSPKQNAVCLAIDSCIAISNIGAIITKLE